MAQPVPAPTTSISDDGAPTALPGPWGLGLLGLTMVILALHLLGLIKAESVLTREGIFFGGLALIIAGLGAWRQKNGIGASAFLGFGLFFLSLMAFVILPAAGVGQPPSRATLLAYLLLWNSFAFILFLASLSLPLCYRLLFGLLTLLLLLLVMEQLVESPLLPTAAGLIALAIAGSTTWAIVARIRCFLA